MIFAFKNFKNKVSTPSLTVISLALAVLLGASGCAGSLATAKPANSSSPTPSPTQGSGDSGSQVASIAIAPKAPSVPTGEMLQLAATITGTTTDKSVTWKAASGHVSST